MRYYFVQNRQVVHFSNCFHFGFSLINYRYCKYFYWISNNSVTISRNTFWWIPDTTVLEPLIPTISFSSLVSGGGGVRMCSYSPPLDHIYLLHVHNKIVQDKLFYIMAIPPNINVNDMTMFVFYKNHDVNGGYFITPKRLGILQNTIKRLISEPRKKELKTFVSN